MTSEEVMKVIEDPGTWAKWVYAPIPECPFHTAFYIKLVEMTSVLNSKGAVGQSFVVVSPHVVNLLAVDHERFKPVTDERTEVHPGLIFVGMLADRWKVYRCDGMQDEECLIGFNDLKGPPKNYARLTTNGVPKDTVHGEKP